MESLLSFGLWVADGGELGFSVGPSDLRGPSKNFMVLWVISVTRQRVG